MESIFCKRLNYKNILFFGCCILAVLSLYNIAHLNMLFVTHDEFGYWANAALIAGKDWSGVSSISPYYSFGYSIVLAPLFFLFSSTNMIYKAAIVMNTVFYIVAYLLSFKCFSYLLKNENKKIIATLCTIVSLYGANLFNVNVAWVEPFIYMLFWFSVYILISIYDTPKYYKIVFFAFILIYMYTVHQRALGVVICGIFAIILLILTKRISYKHVLVFFGSIAVFLFLQIIIKNQIVSILWDHPISSNLSDINDYGGQLSKLMDIFTSPIGFFKMIRGILARYFYLIISSASVVVFGLIYIIKKVIIYFKRKEECPVLEIYCFLSLLCSILISSIYFYQSQRLDTIIYGRYSEFVVAPILIFGFYELLHTKFSKKQIIINISFILIVAGLIYKFMTKQGNYLYICTVNAAIFYDKSNYTFHFISYIIFGIILCSSFYCFWTRKKKIYKVVATCILISFWILSSVDVLKDDLYLCQNYAENIKQISETIKVIDKDYPVYFVLDDKLENSYKNCAAERLQYLLPDTNIQIIQNKDIVDLMGTYFIVTPVSTDLDLTHYTVLSQGYETILVIPDDSKLIDIYQDYMKKNAYIFNETMMTMDVNNSDKEGCITNNQNIAISTGTYEVDMIYNITNIRQDNIGYFEIVTDQGIILHEEIIGTNGKNKYSVIFECSNYNHVNFVFYSYGNAKIDLKEISYIKK